MTNILKMNLTCELLLKVEQNFTVSDHGLKRGYVFSPAINTGFSYLQTSATSKFNEFWLVTVVCHQQNLRVLASDRRLTVAIFSNIGW